MSRAAPLSNYEIRAEGWKALTERLGVSGAIRFLMEYDPGRGDYVEERRDCSATSPSTRRSRESGKSRARRPSAPDTRESKFPLDTFMYAQLSSVAGAS